MQMFKLFKNKDPSKPAKYKYKYTEPPIISTADDNLSILEKQDIQLSKEKQECQQKCANIIHTKRQLQHKQYELMIESQNKLLLQQRNQNTLYYKEVNDVNLDEFVLQSRTIPLKSEMIESGLKLNNGTSNKTIIHVLSKNGGFGDFLRGSILLAQCAKEYNINFKIDTSNSQFSKCLEIPSLHVNNYPSIKRLHFNGGDNDYELEQVLNDFIKSDDKILTISTNLFYNKFLVSQDIKKYINSVFTFKQEYYTRAINLVEFDKYNVLHIRCNDIYFDKEFESDKLIVEIIKLQLGKNTVVISNNYSIKKYIHKLFGFHILDNFASHTGNVDNFTDFESTLIDYIILSRSQSTYAFSFYHHGSGFSEQCSVLNDIPYKVVYLPYTSISQNKLDPLEDLSILSYHFNNILDWPNADIQKNDNYTNVAFITLTTSGYTDYTLNCIESLKRIDTKIKLQCYCIGTDGYNKLTNLGLECKLIEDENNSNFQTFRNGNWSNITYYKFKIIYENLRNRPFVCITDGDIVYENNIFIDFLIQTVGDNDMLIQSEGIEYFDICSGFMFIQSNKTTLNYFNPANVELFKNVDKWDDQVYINSIRHKLKYKKLPLHLFPTGDYYYRYHKNITPYLIHFNWVIGHDKKVKMLQHNKWFNKVKICQHGRDGFGHQLEGMIRVLSVCINNKAQYQYNYKKGFTFEHSNFNIRTLNNYLLEALKLIYSSNSDEPANVEDFKVIMREQRNLSDIVKNDDYTNTIYLYDGVSSNIPEELPPNFEPSREMEHSLIVLRDAFVKNNIYLPPKSYDNEYINVCCHIRMGDAVGSRILDNENIFMVIKQLQKENKYRIIIHSDGDIGHLNGDNTILNNKDVDVLNILSDFIFADILIITYSSLSIAAHLLANEKQVVICPNNAGKSFKPRILDKCITCQDVLKYGL